jgi:hypothetical protein
VSWPIGACLALSSAAFLAAPVHADEEDYLADDALAAAFAGATLIGPNWAEYYAPDGTIIGKVRHLGLLRDFTGRWFIRLGQVCFEYRWSQYNTCSKFRRSGDLMRHFGADGKPKPEGESRRLPGNRLEEFR